MLARGNSARTGLFITVLIANITIHGCVRCQCPVQPSTDSKKTSSPQASIDQDTLSGSPRPNRETAALRSMVVKQRMGSVSPESRIKRISPAQKSARKVDPVTASSPKSDGFGITLYPSTLFVDPGKRKTARVTITRNKEFTGPVRITVSGVPSKVESNAPFTIPRGQVRGFLRLMATEQAAFQRIRVTLEGSVTVHKRNYTATQELTLVVARRRGPFREAIPAFLISGKEKRSPDKRYRVKVEPHTQPGLSQKYAASFYTAAGQPIGPPIGFHADQAARLGGVGFCPNSNAGVVLSTNARKLGLNSDYMLAFLGFSPPKPVRTFEAPTAANGSSAPQPQVFFSPDCTLAAIVTGNKPGDKKKRKVFTLVDLVSGYPLAEEVPLGSSTFVGKVLVHKSHLQVEIRTKRKIKRYPLPTTSQPS